MCVYTFLYDSARSLYPLRLCLAASPLGIVTPGLRIERRLSPKDKGYDLPPEWEFP